mmetsp:Transcript_91898/g.260176  ORF Transcript_91898/g.260176 Transcript_91898/m.260176 type:complete len:221 (-) Transcript_91898:1900-2562(-)
MASWMPLSSRTTPRSTSALAWPSAACRMRHARSWALSSFTGLALMPPTKLARSACLRSSSEPASVGATTSGLPERQEAARAPPAPWCTWQAHLGKSQVCDIHPTKSTLASTYAQRPSGSSGPTASRRSCRLRPAQPACTTPRRPASFRAPRATSAMCWGPRLQTNLPQPRYTAGPSERNLSTRCRSLSSSNVASSSSLPSRNQKPVKECLCCTSRTRGGR